MSWYPIGHVLLEFEPSGLLAGGCGRGGGMSEGSCDIVETGGKMTAPRFHARDIRRRLDRQVEVYEFGVIPGAWKMSGPLTPRMVAFGWRGPGIAGAIHLELIIRWTSRMCSDESNLAADVEALQRFKSVDHALMNDIQSIGRGIGILFT
ncbi:MAG: hypothetical protein Q9184_004679 [Pyrenodesmia sp. 2 TL-2023]